VNQVSAAMTSSAAKATVPFSEAWYIMQRRKPAHAAWLIAKAGEGNDFAVSLLARIKEGQELTPNQAAALDRAVTGAPRATPAPAAKVSVEPMVASLNAAKQEGIKRPYLLTEQFKFARAPDTGSNPGAIYVTANTGGDLYLGKIIGGEFHTSRDCAPEMRDAIVAVCVDPLTAAVAYGKKFGRCSCCGKELSNPESIEAGIGPVCRGKFRL
jgi:hypothetical protein